MLKVLGIVICLRMVYTSTNTALENSQQKSVRNLNLREEDEGRGIRVSQREIDRAIKRDKRALNNICIDD